MSSSNCRQGGCLGKHGNSSYAGIWPVGGPLQCFEHGQSHSLQLSPDRWPKRPTQPCRWRVKARRPSGQPPARIQASSDFDGPAHQLHVSDGPWDRAPRSLSLRRSTSDNRMERGDRHLPRFQPISSDEHQWLHGPHDWRCGYGGDFKSRSSRLLAEMHANTRSRRRIIAWTGSSGSSRH